MSKGEKPRRLVGGLLVVMAGTGAVLAARHGERHAAPAGSPASNADFRGLGSGPLGPAAEPPPPPTAAELQEQVKSAMARWRNAILTRDAAAVISLDGQFRQFPDRFTPALTESARSDGNERVRAFSIRVLGKLHDPELAPTYDALLADASPYVRENAAWALGQLARSDGGRTAAERAVPELRRIGVKDPANEVRLAAKDALGRLE